MISSEAFEHECETKIGGKLFEDSFNPIYQESVTFTVREMRYIANALRKCENLKPKQVTAWVDIGDGIE